jgi:predicted nucleotidyltransferase
LGLHNFEQAESKAPNPDMVIYNIKKFFMLALDNNPNLIEMMNVADCDIKITTKFGEQIRELSDKFLSKKIRHSFTGYAYSQISRIKRHRAYLLNPPKKKPERIDFGMPEKWAISTVDFNAYQKLIDEKTLELPINVMEIFHKEHAFRNALSEWNKYQEWKTNRNPERAEMEAKYGYDSKHAYHCVRLTRMCQEILEGKGVLVKRPDAKELLAIRNGAWSYEKLLEETEKIDKKCGELYQTTKLPHEPNFNYLNDRCMEMIEEFLWQK